MMAGDEIPTLLVFPRHLGCMFHRETASEMRASRSVWAHEYRHAGDHPDDRRIRDLAVVAS